MPQTEIVHGPTGYTNDPTPTFDVSSSQEDAQFTCRIDDQRIAKCGHSVTAETLRNGTHSFSVLARSTGHTADRSPAFRFFIVDTVSPTTRITDGPTSLTDDSTPAFEFNSSEASSTFQCKVDDGAFGSCSSPRALSHLADGHHTFSVRAADRAHNVDPTPAIRAFAVDATTPNTTITSGPRGRTTDATPTFGFKSSESGGSFHCRVDRGATSSCGSPKATAKLAPGPHTFSVSAADGAGNRDATPAVRAFTVKRSR